MSESEFAVPVSEQLPVLLAGFAAEPLVLRCPPHRTHCAIVVNQVDPVVAHRIIGIFRDGMQSHDLPSMGPVVASFRSPGEHAYATVPQPDRESSSSLARGRPSTRTPNSSPTR
ncbi:hypothetical protein ACFWPK_05855 [Nocardia sp. NPDC058519]|uniref:hypothetical protein n=1 Tax=Nocardia sp. NPDC058519 TaxID=3346535 RepID=UPI003661C8C1